MAGPRSAPTLAARALAFLPVLIWISSGCAAGSATAGWPPPEVTEFVITAGDSVVATERTSRSLDRLEGEVLMPGEGRARYVVELTGPGYVRSLEARIGPLTGPDTEALSVELIGDSVVVRSSRWDGLPQRFDVPAAAVYLHPSAALLELLLRRALVTGDSVSTLPVWLVNQYTHASARVTINGGQARVELAGTVVNVVHENGYLILADVPSFGWVVRRQ
jgi:hypothetical protein